MSNKKNSDNKLSGTREEELHRETLGNESNTSTAIHRGKRSAFNEDADLSTNPPGRKRDFSDPSSVEEGDEDYDDEETEHDDYFEDAHYKNEEIEVLREEQKEFEGYGDDDALDKP
jgi:hypothetical protein